VTQDTPAFFTLDRGTVSSTAALIAPVDGRYRMVAAASAPAAIDPESEAAQIFQRIARSIAVDMKPKKVFSDKLNVI